MEWEGYWLKAKENLEMAALAHQGKRFNVCASRAYYAVFQASIAALLKLTQVRAKDNIWQHRQVQAELNRQLIIRKKVLPSEIGRIPLDLIELRHLADYKPEPVTAKESNRAYNRAERFLSSIKKVVEDGA